MIRELADEIPVAIDSGYQRGIGYVQDVPLHVDRGGPDPIAFRLYIDSKYLLK